MDSRLFYADAGYKRIDLFLNENTDDELSRSAIKKLIEGGNVTVNGKTCKAGQPVKLGDEIRLTVPEPVDTDAKPEDIPIDVVYEDDDLAVINKRQGMVVHAGNGNYSGTLVNALLFKLNSLSGINGVLRPGIVHRIDKDTSGLLVVAKNDAAHLSLSKQIAEKSCKREYLALLEGVLATDDGKVETQIARSPSDRTKMAVVKSGGRNGVTYYEVEERFSAYTLVRFKLATGRTHQIRVHARYLGHAVVGDKAYNAAKARFNLNGQLLHACKLSFTHPRTNEQMCFTAPLPDYFERVLKLLRDAKG